MARPLRIQYEHAFYHITGRGNERKMIFLSKADHDKFKVYLKEAQDRYGFILHAYVLMGNHYHLLGETPQANLSAIMHFISGSYTTYFNKKRNRSGHLFQGRYKAILIDRDSYLLELSRYIHLNPVKAHMAEKPEDYIYSSYAAYTSPQKEDIVTRDLIWAMISRNKNNAPQLYQSFVEEALSGEKEDPFKDLYAGIVLGKKSFIKDALSLLNPDSLQKDDTSSRRSLKTQVSMEEIIEIISHTFGVPEEQIVNKKGLYRNLALYVIRRSTGFTNREIGRFFGNISYSAVTKIYQRFDQALRKDKNLQDKVARIERQLSQFKG
jgi:putative transposase